MSALRLRGIAYLSLNSGLIFAWKKLEKRNFTGNPRPHPAIEA
jgi:hypothetical protein